VSFRTAYGNSRSENGWRMCNRDECVLVPGPHMDTAPLRRGPAEIILGDLVRRYNNEVAPVISSVWGWSQYNDVGNSNHLAGTALDINAPQWPWGLRTMPAPLVDKCNRLNDSYGGATYWGNKWNRPDQMHFQLNWPEGDARYNAIIAKIQSGGIIVPPIPATPDLPNGSWAPTLQYGSSGASVTKLQAAMNRVFSGYAAMPLVVDGDFGPATKAAVVEFQRRTNIGADGIVGPQTWSELAKYGVKP
jgi:peptidoglycan hydrolase-like protein with peptidoglycan-binding domain